MSYTLGPDTNIAVNININVKVNVNININFNCRTSGNIENFTPRHHRIVTHTQRITKAHPHRCQKRRALSR